MKRFITRSSFSLGRGRVFVAGYQQKDGSQGYTEDQLAGLSRKQLADFFDEVEITGSSIVEEATAQPGEKRMLSSHECEVDGCDFTSRTKAGIAAHQRSHS